MNSFLLSTITKWNKLELSIRISTSVFTRHNPIKIKYLTGLRLGFSHIPYHKFKHGFLDAVDPLCSCSTAIENTVHYFLHCLNFSTARNTFLKEMAIVDRSIIHEDKIKIIQTFLYGNPTYSVNGNKLILHASIKYILETKRFDGPIFQVKESWSIHNCQNRTAQAFFFYHHHYYFLLLLLLFLFYLSFFL